MCMCVLICVCMYVYAGHENRQWTMNGANLKGRELGERGQWNTCDTEVEDDIFWSEEGCHQRRVAIRA